jgi:Ca2+-binding RTX toxin-like protein
MVPGGASPDSEVPMALTSKITLDIVSTLTKVLDLATGKTPLNRRAEYSWESGTGADQADLVFHDQRTLAASATENIDLAGGLTDAYGATITFARIKALIVIAAAGNTNDVQVGGAASNAWATWVANSSDIVTVKPDGILALVSPSATGYVVTAGTGDILKIVNSGAGTGVTYDIVLIGSSA